MKAAAVEIVREDDEGNICVETVTLGDAREIGHSLHWLQTVKEIKILDTCLLDHGGTCEECAWSEVARAECQEDRG